MEALGRRKQENRVQGHLHLCRVFEASEQYKMSCQALLLPCEKSEAGSPQWFSGLLSGYPSAIHIVQREGIETFLSGWLCDPGGGSQSDLE